MLWSVLPYFIDPLGIREPFTSPLRSALKELVKIASGRKAEAGCWPLRSSFMLQAVPSSSWCLWGLGASEAGGGEAWAPCLLLFLKPLSITSYLKPHVCLRDTKLWLGYWTMNAEAQDWRDQARVLGVVQWPLLNNFWDYGQWSKYFPNNWGNKLNNGELVTCHKQHIVLFFSLSYLFLFYFGEKYFTQIHGGTWHVRLLTVFSAVLVLPPQNTVSMFSETPGTWLSEYHLGFRKPRPEIC